MPYRIQDAAQCLLTFTYTLRDLVLFPLHTPQTPVMNRHLRNENVKFRRESSVHMQDMQSILEQRQAAMTQEWGNLDRGWEDLKNKMSEVGMSMRSANIPDRLLMNVGGSEVYVSRHVLEGLQESSAVWTLGDLFGGGVWDKDKRLPRDSLGLVFVDESPTCFQHLIRGLSRRIGKAGGAHPDPAVEGLPADELPCLPHVAGALGLSPPPPPPTAMTVKGGSAVLEGPEVDTLTTTILGWCPGEPDGLELLYRASRDSWNLGRFLSKSDNSAPTLFLIRVLKAGANGVDTNDSSVIGGYSSIPFNTVVSDERTVVDDPESFVFLLKDGEHRSGTFKPVKWGARKNVVPKLVNKPDVGLEFGIPGRDGGFISSLPKPEVGLGFGADFRARSDLFLRCSRRSTFAPYPFAPYNSRGLKCFCRAGNYTYDIPEGSPFLALDGRLVREVEVFRVCSNATVPAENCGAGLIDCATTLGTAATNTEAHDEEDDLHWFGAAVAGSLERERTALRHAQSEFMQANQKAAASAQALAAMYGPHAAEGKEDPVIEFSIRGARTTTWMATLLSTILWCPPGIESVLAVRYWRWADNDNDAHGRWQINGCSPHMFAKLLDVLRMKKRAGWGDSSSLGSGRPGRVGVKSSDRSSFEELVDMYFPGGKGSILDSVDFTTYDLLVSGVLEPSRWYADYLVSREPKPLHVVSPGNSRPNRFHFTVLNRKCSTVGNQRAYIPQPSMLPSVMHPILFPTTLHNLLQDGIKLPSPTDGRG